MPRPRATDVLGVGIAIALIACAAPEPAPPNVLLIVVDDLGMNDLGAYGNPDVRTPRLDRLAREGIRFTRHYADSTCAPARAALVTGRHPARAGFRPRGRGISVQTETLADRLRARGYATHHIGKWHLGGEGAWGLEPSPLAALPQSQGFDHWFGFANPLLLQGIRQGRMAFRAWHYASPWLVGGGAVGRPVEGHLTEILTDRAIDVIRAAGDEPWFLNLAYLAPHAPIEPAPRFAGRYPDTSEGLYRAMLEQLDHEIGRVLDALDATGRRASTLVVVVSDNGSPADDYPSNDPFPGRKIDFLEGGVRAPLIVRGPADFSGGREVDAPVSILDLYPTVLAAAGIPPPEGLDGRDLGPLLREGRWPPRALFWELEAPDSPPSYAVLSADSRWRLVGQEGTYDRLFDLARDPATSEDVADRHPEVVQELRALYASFRRDTARVALDFRSAGPRGQGVLTGDDFQRSPGWGGFLFAIGVTPSSGASEGSEWVPKPEVIAFQREVWSATATSGGPITVDLDGHRLRSRPLPPDRCAAVVLSAHFHYASLAPEATESRLALYVDGTLVDSAASDLPSGAGDLASPTYVGLPVGELEAFAGRLSRPIVENRAIRSNGDRARLAAISAELCPPNGDGRRLP